MKIRKERIGPDSPLFQKNCGNFTQIRLVAVFKDGKELPIVQFFGLQAKILSESVIKQFGWKITN